MKLARACVPADAISDAELLRSIAAGEIGALGALYDRHHGSLRRFLTRASAGADDVDDLVHATFLSAAKSAARYDGRISCRPWLFGIAVRLLRRRRVSFARLLRAIASLRARPSSIDPRDRLEARKDVERALARLSEAKRVTFVMAEVEGLSCAEIAEALDVPVGTVWGRLHAARRELRRALEGTP